MPTTKAAGASKATGASTASAATKEATPSCTGDVKASCCNVAISWDHKGRVIEPTECVVESKKKEKEAGGHPFK